MGHAVRFGLLGPLLVLRDDEPVAVGGPKQRALLALLLLRHNRFLSADWLVDALWDGHPPSGARVTLRSYVAGLRRALEPGRGPRAAGELLRGHAGGYELSVPPASIDAVRFTELVDGAAATPDPASAERRYAEALALWRGDLPLELAAVRPDLARLTEARLAAEEGRCASAVAAARHLAVLPDLRRFVAAHPEREAAREQLMLALYRAGRQTEALAVFDEGRRALAADYGVEPGERLRELHRQVLGHAVPPPAAPAPAAPAPAARLVGREAEVGLLAGMLDAARHDGGRVVAVVGEAGIGKTSLATAVEESAGDTPVVWGRCPDVGQAPPFWLWAQVVRALVTRPEAGRAGADTALAGFAAEPAAEPATGGLDPAARFRTYEAVSALVRAVAEPAGLVLVLDDLHAADPDSLLLLRYLASTLHGSRVLVVATLRPYERDPALVAALADLARQPGFRQLRPAGLDAEAVADLVRGRTGAPAPAELVRRLVTRTGGNPFFITELLAAPEGEPPPSVRDAVRLRLHALDEPTRECLDLLSVAGRELDLRLLGPHATRLAVTDLVTGAGPGAVRFRHPLFAEVAYAELAPPRRAALHARLADACARSGGLSPAELAHHYGQAAGLGRDEDHLRWTLRAAEDAARRLAYEDAMAHLDRAAARLALTSATSPAAAEAELAVQLRRTALLQITAGVGSDAVDRVCARARDLLAVVGPDADVRTALWTLGELACNRAEHAIAEDLATRLLEADDSGVIAAAGRYLLGVVGYFTGRLAEADEHLSAAVDRLRDLDPRLLSGQTGRTPALAVHDFRALVRSLRGDPVGARTDIAAARALAERVDDPYGRANAALFAAWAALQEHDVVAGRAAAARCREIGARQNMPHFVTVGDFLTEWAAVRGGDATRLAAMREAGEAIYRPGLRSTRTITIAAVAEAHLAAGDAGAAAVLAEEGLAVADEVGERVLVPELLRVRGLALGDAEDLREGARLAAAQGAHLLLPRFPPSASTTRPTPQGR
ncbi:BTAD domain-containing putative transcriptional regulator [Saccharothrix coeruleofusca]|uniref:OmpR/PhoB-type domain-containing protein n=1 Tax=Saccharothrix coeruleofusca TaxID=33919 RepID=A0A918EG26_9PSEU|nr:BTAD domain-containing putative transcriptional regulator [Saccharothrix coeruleofusca]GGP77827.1 hypothetical protein GCM10010185_59620 [Saccharothrix coeruleofusca]